MTELNRQRPVIDLDELERQLREAAGPRAAARAQAAPASAHRQEDPLAELARIVGQDDPFKALWPERDAGGGRADPPMGHAHPTQHSQAHAPQADPYGRQPTAQSFEDQLSAYETQSPQAGALPYQLRQPAAQPEPEQDWAPRQAYEQHQAPQPTHAAYDDRYARDEAEPVYEPQGQLPPHEQDFEPAPRKNRKGLVAVGALLGVLAVGGAGSYAFRGSSTALKVAGVPPLIKADTGPSKVQPVNPGGVEVPNQDRQIYNRAQVPEDLKNVKVSGRTEQPVDVEQITRRDIPADTAQAVANGTSTGGQAAAAPKPLPPSGLPQLGEPRRVKTVSVRPDGTIIESEAAPTRVASLGNIGASSGAPAPSATQTSTGSTPVPAPAPRPKPAAAAVPAPTTTATIPARPKPAAPEADTATTTASTPKPAAAPRQQVAAVQPASAPVAEAASGGWAVQLAAPQSEAEAKDAISKLQKRFSDELSGMKPGVRKADVNGKTIYRVRVGGMSREDATSLCTKLQGAGGQCFVAKN